MEVGVYRPILLIRELLEESRRLPRTTRGSLRLRNVEQCGSQSQRSNGWKLQPAPSGGVFQSSSRIDQRFWSRYSPLRRNDLRSTPSQIAPTLRSAPLPRPFRTAARASSRCTPRVLEREIEHQLRAVLNTPVPQNADPIAKPHSAVPNPGSSWRTWKIPIARVRARRARPRSTRNVPAARWRASRR